MKSRSPPRDRGVPKRHAAASGPAMRCDLIIARLRSGAGHASRETRVCPVERAEGPESSAVRFGQRAARDVSFGSRPTPRTSRPPSSKRGS